MCGTRHRSGMNDGSLQWGLRWCGLATWWILAKITDAGIAARCAVSTGHIDRPGHERSDSWFDICAGVLKQCWRVPD
jgi:hypothetical protein